MIQTDLFSQTQAHQLFKNGGPETSREAAEELATTGKLAGMELRALNLVTRYPGATGAELEKMAGLERGQVSKRLSSLVNQGRIIRGDKRKCNITQRAAFTHYTKANKPR